MHPDETRPATTDPLKVALIPAEPVPPGRSRRLIWTPAREQATIERTVSEAVKHLDPADGKYVVILRDQTGLYLQFHVTASRPTPTVHVF